jgi:hypothetical protein
MCILTYMCPLIHTFQRGYVCVCAHGQRQPMLATQYYYSLLTPIIPTLNLENHIIRGNSCSTYGSSDFSFIETHVTTGSYSKG